MCISLTTNKMTSISYTITAPFALRKRAMERLAAEQWERIERIEDELYRYQQMYDDAMKDHCEASLYLLGTSSISSKYTLHPNPDAYDHYVRTVREFGCIMISVVSKQQSLASAQDRYNEIVIQLEDMCSPPIDNAIDIDDDNEPVLDEIFTIEPPLTRRARIAKRKAKSKKN